MSLTHVSDQFCQDSEFELGSARAAHLFQLGELEFGLGALAFGRLVRVPLLVGRRRRGGLLLLGRPRAIVDRHGLPFEGLAFAKQVFVHLGCLLHFDHEFTQSDLLALDRLPELKRPKTFGVFQTILRKDFKMFVFVLFLIRMTAR